MIHSPDQGSETISLWKGCQKASVFHPRPVQDPDMDAMDSGTVERTVSVDIADLACVICMNAVYDPVVIECQTRVDGRKCESLICREPCMKLLIEKQRSRPGVASAVSGKCIICRKPWQRYQTRPMVTLHNITANLRRTCPNAANGCDFTGLHPEIRNHARECAYVRVECPNRSFGCEKVILRRNLDEHRRDCEFFPCKFSLNGDGCVHTGLFAWIQEHERTCEYSSEPCVSVIQQARRRYGAWRSCNENNLLRWDLCRRGEPYDEATCPCHSRNADDARTVTYTATETAPVDMSRDDQEVTSNDWFGPNPPRFARGAAEDASAES